MTTSIKYSVHQCCDVKEYLGVNRLKLNYFTVSQFTMWRGKSSDADIVTSAFYFDMIDPGGTCCYFLMNNLANYINSGIKLPTK